jgi:hypothetical protein
MRRNKGACQWWMTAKGHETAKQGRKAEKERKMLTP